MTVMALTLTGSCPVAVAGGGCCCCCCGGCASNSRKSIGNKSEVFTKKLERSEKDDYERFASV